MRSASRCDSQRGSPTGGIAPVALARAERAAHLYAAYCDAAGIHTVDVVATSAVREAANQREVLDVLSIGRLAVRVLSAEQEAWYGYLGVVNGSTLADGWFVDLGGGSMQIGRVDARRLTRSMSAPLGAVRLTEAFLTGDQRDAKQIAALRAHVRTVLESYDWIGGNGRIVGIGGALRTLAVMQQRAERGPLIDPHGHRMSRQALAATIDALIELPAGQRSRLPGLRADRADIILAAALTDRRGHAGGRIRRPRGLRPGPARGRVPGALPRPRRPAAVAGRSPQLGHQRRRELRVRARTRRADRPASR